MKKTIFISILVTLLIIIASCSPRNQNTQPEASCGDGNITPPEPCDTKNDNCPVGSFCSQDCSTCKKGVYCCTDKLSGEGARYWEVRKTPQDCTEEKLVIDDCYDVNGVKKDPKPQMVFDTETEAGRNCVFDYACINNQVVKLCGDDYNDAVQRLGIFTGTKAQISEFCPRPTTTSFKVNDVQNIKDCENEYTIAYVSLDDPSKEVVSVEFMYKTSEQKSWTGMKNGLFYDQKINQYYNSAKLNPGNYQYEILVKTTSNTLIVAKQGSFNVDKCPEGPLA